MRYERYGSVSLVRLEPIIEPTLTPFGPVTFYFGTTMPDGAGPSAVLDDGTGFATGRDGGYDYGKTVHTGIHPYAVVLTQQLPK